MSFLKVSSLLLLVSIHLTASESTMEEMHQIVAPIKIICMDKTNAREDQVSDVSRGKLSEDRELKCFLNCFLETVETLTDGKLNYDNTLQKIKDFLPMDKKEEATYALKTCKNSIDGIDDHCEAAFILTTCFFHENSETLFP